MLSEDISLLESFVLTSYEDTIQKMIKGSDMYYYLTILKNFEEYGFQVPQEINKMIDEYKEFQTTGAKDIKLRKLFLELEHLEKQQETPDLESKKKEIIQNLNKVLFNQSFNQTWGRKLIKNQDSYESDKYNENQSNHSYEQEEQNDDDQDENQYEYEDCEYVAPEKNFDSDEGYQQKPQHQERDRPTKPKLRQVEQTPPLSKQTSEQIQQNLQFNKKNRNQLSAQDSIKKKIDEVLNKAYTEDGIDHLPDHMYFQLDTDKLLQSPLKVRQNFISKINFAILDYPNFHLIYQNLLNDPKFNKAFSQGHFDILNLNQMDKLLETDEKFLLLPIFMDSYFLKKFHPQKDYDIQNQEHLQELRTIFNQIYQWGLGLPPFYSIIEKEALLAILQIGDLLKEYDFDLFLQYQYKYNNQDKNLWETQTYQLKLDFKQFFNATCNIFLVCSYGTLNERYLKVYFQKNDNYEIFIPYFDEKLLREQFSKTKLYQGTQVQNIYDIFSEEQLRIMNDEKQLYINGNNKNLFKHNEHVKLSLSMKNIPALNIKIFQIGAENYYLQKMQEIGEQIKLDGLIASEEIEFKYDYPPIVSFEKEFEFDTITNQRNGVFMIVFTGNGLQSKAIIRKGRLVLKQKKTSAGQVFQVLDENFQVQANPRTGIWIDKIFHKINNNNEIIIPYQECQKNQKVIIVNDTFAELSDIQLLREEYQLNCQFIVQDEQIIVGKQAKVIVIPQLLIHNTIINLELLYDVQIQVSQGNETKQMQTFNNFDLTKPIEIQFIVLSLENIEIKFSSKIKRINQSERKEDLLEKSTIISYDLRNSIQNIFCSQFLRYSSEGYLIYLLGKNGEPKQGITLDIQLLIQDLNEQISVSLITDQDGKVTIGELNNIRLIQSIVKEQREISSDQSWNLFTEKQQYPSSIDAVIGQQLKFTLDQNNKKYYFVEVFDDLIISDYTNTYTSIENNNIIVKAQKEGQFKLIINYIKQIKITIHNQSLGEENYIIQNHELIRDYNGVEKIQIKNVEQLTKEDQIFVKGSISGQNKAKLIVLASTFYNPNNGQKIYESIQQLISKNENSRISATPYQNKYLNDKRLSDEEVYVLNRKNQERYIGNTLEKPQLLLKRQFVNDTEQQTEVLKPSEEFDNNLYSKQMIRAIMKERFTPCSNLLPSDQINEFQNFLNITGQVIILDVQKDGLFEFKLDNSYQSINIIAYDDNSSTIQKIGLNISQIQTRDQTFVSKKKENKFYSFQRSIQIINESIDLNEIKGSQFKIVDSLEQVGSIIDEIQKALSLFSSTQNWSFLIKWNNNNLQEKNQLYEEFQCNELNLFIYFKDPAYFETNIKYYISSKIEKDFIDHFLLENHIYLLDNAQVQKFIQLNILEQVLLIIYFQEIAINKEIASILYQYLVDKSNIQELDVQLNQRLFDIVVGIKGQNIDFDCENKIYDDDQSQKELIGGIQIGSFGEEKECFERREIEEEEVECYVEEKRKEKCKKKSRKRDRRSSLNQYDIQRQAQVEQFKNAEKTKKYCERHYYEENYLFSETRQVTQISSNNKFWIDLATHSIQKGIFQECFVSTNFIYNHQSLIEKISALIFIGLPFEQPQQKIVGNQLQLDQPTILFKKQLNEAQVSIRNDIILYQRIFDPKNSENRQDQQFIIDKVYGIEVIIINCNPDTLKNYEINAEIPIGAIELNAQEYKNLQKVQLIGYRTQQFRYYFYFPSPGEYKLNPAYLEQDGKILSVGKEQILDVKTKKLELNQEVLDDILQTGNNNDILNFIATKNIFDPKVFSDTQIIELIQDKSLYLEIIKILRKRLFYSESIWVWSIHHGDYKSFKEFLNSQYVQRILIEKFQYFKCDLVEIQSIRFYEYYPLLTKRIHKMNNQQKGILNLDLRQHYLQFLNYLIQKQTLSLNDKLAFIYYLLLQERINESITVFNTIKEVPQEGEAILQYDYFTAYLDFYIGYPNFIKARQICEKYLNYPVLHWRNLFYEIINQLSEFDGDFEQETKVQTQKQKQITKESTLEIETQGSQIIVTYSNLEYVEFEFYRIDLEILFSQNPFENQQNNDYTFVQPNATLKIDLKSSLGLSQKQTVEIPADLLQQNLCIYAKANNKRSQTRYYSTSINVQVMENNGQLRVTDKQGKYLSKIYVKTFCQEKDGKVLFYKDGYTDLRGRFDYASLSSSDLEKVSKFAILIMSDTLGSIVKEVQAPSQLGRYEQQVKLVSKTWEQKANNSEILQKQVYATSQIKYKRKY